MTPALTRKSRVTGLKAVLFDKDGTLLDYFGPWLPRANKAIATLESPLPDDRPRVASLPGNRRPRPPLSPKGRRGSLPAADDSGSDGEGARQLRS